MLLARQTEQIALILRKHEGRAYLGPSPTDWPDWRKLCPMVVTISTSIVARRIVRVHICIACRVVCHQIGQAMVWPGNGSPKRLTARVASSG